MNYTEKIRYHIYTAEKAPFEEMVNQLLKAIRKQESVLRLLFFGTPNEQVEYSRRKSIIQDKVKAWFGDKLPTVSYISQPPLDAPLVLEVHAFVPDPDDRISYRTTDGLPYVLMENSMGRFLFAGGFQGNLNSPMSEQSEEVFKKIGNLLQKEGFATHQIIRQWNYIERITDYEKDNQHYQLFNNARSAFYNQTTWSNGYPAATGIGTNLGGVLVDMDVVLFKDDTSYAVPIDNKLQVAAHAYSGDVLEHANQRKTTPKFERAKSIHSLNNRLIYISGTAAIRGENSLKNVGLAKQLQITMENIAELIDEAKLLMLRVYLKYPEDYEEAAGLMSTYQLNISISYMWADVCRDELLIEIEGVAID